MLELYTKPMPYFRQSKIANTAPANSHEPIHYPVGVIKESKHKKEATSFYEYLQSKDAQSIFKKYGFTILS